VQHGGASTGFADGQDFLPPLGSVTLPEVSLGEAAPATELASLADPALLSALLSLVLPEDSTELAAHTIAKFGSFAAVLAAPADELRTVRGLGPHSVAAIKLVHAASLRLARAGVMDQPVLDDWDRLIAYLTAVLARERVEQFRILFLDAEGRLRADEAQARGTVNHTPVYPREVVRRALELKAASLILVHNHPSGDPTASREDVEMTRRILDAGAVVGVAIRDHVIIGNGRWLSFRTEGMLGDA
jgi:DNA repair protein RadC